MMDEKVLINVFRYETGIISHVVAQLHSHTYFVKREIETDNLFKYLRDCYNDVIGIILEDKLMNDKNVLIEEKTVGEWCL